MDPHFFAFASEVKLANVPRVCTLRAGGGGARQSTPCRHNSGFYFKHEC